MLGPEGVFSGKIWAGGLAAKGSHLETIMIYYYTIIYYDLTPYTIS